MSVIRLYDEDSDKMEGYERSLCEAALSIRPDDCTPHGSRGMGGITKHYGLASSRAVALIRLDERAKAVFSALYETDPSDLMCSWDAVAITGMDALRKRPLSHRICFLPHCLLPPLPLCVSIMPPPPLSLSLSLFCSSERVGCGGRALI